MDKTSFNKNFSINCRTEWKLLRVAFQTWAEAEIRQLERSNT